jgi:hypothetical protein
MNARPDFASLNRTMRDERNAAADKIAAQLKCWSADVDRAVAICSEECDDSVHFAVQAIENTPHQLQEHEMAVLAGALFRAIYRDRGNLHIEARQDALAGLSDVVDELLGEVVRQREGVCS